MLLVLPGCGPSAEEAAKPATLKLLVMPDRPRGQIESTYAPLVQHLSRKLALPCELVIPASYEQTAGLFHRREVPVRRGRPAAGGPDRLAVVAKTGHGITRKHTE